MRRIYSGIGWVVAFLVVVQAGAIAVGFGGMMHFVDGGGVVDKALTESRTLGNFTGEVGFPVHALVGGLILPLLALVQLIVSWFTRAPGASWLAAGLFLLILIQGTIGYSIKDLPYLGALHGINAFAVLAVAVAGALRLRAAARASASTSDTTHAAI
jgi:hypothetical protein